MKKLVSFAITLSLLSSCGLNELEDDISSINDRLSQLEKDVDVLQKDVELLKSEVQQLGEDGKLYASEIKHLNLVFDQLSQILEISQTGDSLSSGTVDGLKLLLTAFLEHSDTENLNATLSNWIAQIDLATSGVDSLTSANNAISLNIEVIQEMVDGLNTEINTLKVVSVDQTLNGNVFKGPFIKGSLLTFYEMNNEFFLTGRSFTSAIKDEYGSYELKFSNAKGKLFQVVVDGFYWNEVTGFNSSSKINLSGVFRMDSLTAINVNILTHLEKPRVEYLVETGLSYDSAKLQALNEVLGIFEIENPGASRAEDIDLSQAGEIGKIAFSVSTLLQGFRTESEISEILTDMSNDLKEDGVISDISLGNDLMTHLSYIDTSSVKQGFINKFQNTIDSQVLSKLDFSYLTQFASKTLYVKDYDLIKYDQYLVLYNRVNLLYDGLSNVSSSSSVGIGSRVLSDGMSLKVTIEKASDGTYPTNWYFGASETWTYDIVDGIILPVFYVTGKGNHELEVYPAPGNYIVKYYERDSSTPTRTKTLMVN
ncbi:MAG: hypothetical protein ACMVP2_15370 [Imperialibacter sp.]|uniref:hypothetical protein n=1 Tax=Imperialibacter sp. TaxID=2038411 RepID=UPI003A8BBC2C